MKHLLLTINQDNEHAIAQAETVRDLFDTENVRGHLFHDFTDNPEGASIRQVGSVNDAREILENAGIDIEYHEGSGKPSESIIRLADDLDVDAICVSGRKRSPAGKMLFGSVAQKVILGSDRPVLVCSADEGVQQ